MPTPTELEDCANSRRLRQMKAQRAANKRQTEQQGELALPAAESTPFDKVAPAPQVVVKAASKPATKKSRGMVQADFFAPLLYDVGARDSRGVMDVAVFRLSKNEPRPNSVIRYELPDGYVQVSSGVYGMASVWDYDIVLMAVSHLTEAMNQFRDGKGEKPAQVFRPHISEVLKFCEKNMGGNQKDSVVEALQRLSTTHVSIERTRNVGDKPMTITEGENLIGPFKVVSSAKGKQVEYVEIKIADWMYQEITQGHKPDVLTVHPDYFKISQGVARFVYRLARKAAGKDMAVWGFKTLYSRSGSLGPFKEFARLLRKVIKANDLPEYDLAEEEGLKGPMLRMVHRSIADKWKEAPPNAQPEPEAAK